MVVSWPDVVHWRITFAPVSAIKRLPSDAKTRPLGVLRPEMMVLAAPARSELPDLRWIRNCEGS